MKNPKLYRELSQPFESLSAAQTALDSFQSELGELRKKYKIPNVACTVAFSAVCEDDQEGEAMSVFLWGDMLKHESMLAYALGMQQADRQSMIAGLLSKGLNKPKKED